jgi:hypothetical protein
MSEEGKKEQEANFNDAELQDIMAEIESLEQEFSEDEQAEAEASEEQVAAEVLDQEEPEAAVVEELEEDEPVTAEAEQEEVEPVAVEAHDEVHEETSEDNSVLSFEQDAPAATVAKGSSAGPMSFQGEGTLNFSMNFQVGSEEALVAVNSGKINVTMGDIDLTISEDG